MKAFLIALCTLLILSLFPRVAFAYIDPGTGSQVFQLMLAALAGAALTARMFWGRIRAFFRSLTGPGSGDS